MIVSINQPAYLPWLGYFHRIASSDVHVVLDHVQMGGRSFTNRNKIRTTEGWCWLTVPVHTKGSSGELPINQLQIAYERPWAAKHLARIRESYSKTPFFAEREDFLRSIYARRWIHLKDMIAEMNRYFLAALDIQTPVVLSSSLNIESTKTELNLDICKALGATTYLSGALGRQYLHEERFVESGIRVEYQDYVHPVYHQAHGGFEPYMAIIDLLFNHGNESRGILMSASQAVPAGQLQ